MILMAIAVVTDLMAFSCLPEYSIRIPVNQVADQKERRLDIAAFQVVQKLRSMFAGAIVKGNSYLTYITHADTAAGADAAAFICGGDSYISITHTVDSAISADLGDGRITAGPNNCFFVITGGNGQFGVAVVARFRRGAASQKLAASR